MSVLNKGILLIVFEEKTHSNRVIHAPAGDIYFMSYRGGLVPAVGLTEDFRIVGMAPKEEVKR